VERLTIDLNCDMGEGCGNDAELMGYISSANVACGYHAGTRDTMRITCELAVSGGVAVGAHPGYPDRENFGRTNMDLPPAKVYQIVTDQIATLQAIAKEAGTSLAHVKPHGALYNQAARDPELAAAIADAVWDFDPELVLFGLSSSEYVEIAESRGLKVASEVFADRTYQVDASLTPRSEPNALITETDAALAQVLEMVRDGTVTAVSGEKIPIRAETLCIHGDGAHAVEFAGAIRKLLRDNNIEINATR